VLKFKKLHTGCVKNKKTILYTECDTNLKKNYIQVLKLKKKLYTGCAKIKKNIYIQDVLKLKIILYTGCAKIKKIIPAPKG
jgi:hypothetical protein